MSQEVGIPQTSYMLITIGILFQDPLDICDVEKDLISLTLFQLSGLLGMLYMTGLYFSIFSGLQ